MAWSPKTWKCLGKFGVFLEKRPFMVKISKCCSEVSPLHKSSPIDVVVLKCRKIYLTKNRRNRTDPSQTVATVRIAPKICQGQPPTFGSQWSRFHSFKSVHFRRSYSRTREGRSFASSSNVMIGSSGLIIIKSDRIQVPIIKRHNCYYFEITRKVWT